MLTILGCYLEFPFLLNCCRFFVQQHLDLVVQQDSVMQQKWLWGKEFFSVLVLLVQCTYGFNLKEKLLFIPYLMFFFTSSFVISMSGVLFATSLFQSHEILTWKHYMKDNCTCFTRHDKPFEP